MRNQIIGCVLLTLLVAITGIGTALEPSSMSQVLKTPNSSIPYEDKTFLERADVAVTNFTNPLPTENDLFELQSIYYEIIKKNISPELYPEAKNITKFIFYTMKASEEMRDYREQTGTKHIGMPFKDNIYEQARTDASEATLVLRNITSRYPNATISLE